MSLPANTTAVVILDVMNLRGSEGKRKDAPFRIEHFDVFIGDLGRVVPSAVIVGIVDGTASQEGRRGGFASKHDSRELLRRTNLDPGHPQHLLLLPAPEKRWGWGKDLKYLPADPVCVHLLEKFPDNAALITFDLFDKDSDIAYFPESHELRRNIYAPFWLKSEQSWVYLSREEVNRFQKWDYEFFRAAEIGSITRLEGFLTHTTSSESEYAEIRQEAYGYVHDFVNEHRAAESRVVPLVLSWQKPRSAFDVLNPEDFAEGNIRPIEIVDDEPIDVGESKDSNVLVRVATEHVDLIRSIDQLQIYAGKRVAVQAMLQMYGDSPYLTWLGRMSRVKVTLWNTSVVPKSGFVRVEGVLTSDDEQLTISVTSENDLRYHSVGDAVTARLAQLVKRDIYVGGGGPWTFPHLSWRPTRRIPSPPPSPVIRGPAITIDDEVDSGPHTGPEHVGGVTEAVSGGTAASTREPSPVFPVGGPVSGPIAIDAVGMDLLVRRTKWKMLAWIATACLVAAAIWFVLQAYVFAFEIPDPAVCANLEPEVCEAIIAEWQGDALRIHLYGTRGAGGVVR